MGLNLSKGDVLNLEKSNPLLRRLRVGLGWDTRNEFPKFDLDAQVILLGANGKVRTNDDVIYYNNKTSVCGAVTHMGDNRTGEGEGDDEQIAIELDKLPQDVEAMAFTVTIFKAGENNQNFGQVQNAYIRLINDDDKQEVARFNLTNDYSFEKSMIMGELVKNAGEWNFKALGQGKNVEMGELCAEYGVA